MNKIDSNMIEKTLDTEIIGKKTLYFDRLDSTNDYIKRIAKDSPHGMVVICDEQTSGRGRLGRTWFTPRGKAISMSILLKPDLHPKEGMRMTQIGIAAVVEAITKLMDLKILVKWPNDLLIENKKVAGILTEMVTASEKIDYLIIGMGINVNTKEFPKDIEDRAGSLALFEGKDIDRQKLIISILREFEILYMDYIKRGELDRSLKIIRNYSAILGREVHVIRGGSRYRAQAVDIDDSGLLRVRYMDGREELLHSGEVSIRGESTYI